MTNTTNIEIEFKLFEKEMNTAIGNQIDILSPDNFKLSAKYMDEVKINPLEIVRYRYLRPIVTNLTAKGRAKNRRVDIIQELKKLLF